MASSLSALVVGGGIGGMSAAIALRRQGLAVRLIDLDPQWRVYGAGITITGATLRAFRDLGVLDEVMAQAYTGEGIQVCDLHGRPLRLVETPPADVGLPGCGGIMRPVLHRILSAHTLACGVSVRLGLTVDHLQTQAGGVEARLSDGSRETHDLVVGADGLNSRVRGLLFPGAPRPAYTGQNVWRVVAPRPPGLRRRHFFLGGVCKVGLTPVSADEMYMFVLETAPRRPIMPDAELPGALAELLRDYGGPVGEVRDSLGPASQIVLRPLEAFELPAPWHLGRTLLIGDAAHPTTPQLASGAGMAAEDGLVLAEELGRAGDVPTAMAAWMARRHERCRLVVSNSMEIGRREQRRAPIEEQTALVEQSLRILAQPI